MILLTANSIRVILIEFFEEICLRMMSLIVLLEVGFRQEELGAVATLYHVLLLFRGQSHEILISAKCLLLDLQLFLQCFEILMLCL